jgi:hypothetical protein
MYCLLHKLCVTTSLKPTLTERVGFKLTLWFRISAATRAILSVFVIILSLLRHIIIIIIIIIHQSYNSMLWSLDTNRAPWSNNLQIESTGPTYYPVHKHQALLPVLRVHTYTFVVTDGCAKTSQSWSCRWRTTFWRTMTPGGRIQSFSFFFTHLLPFFSLFISHFLVLGCIFFSFASFNRSCYHFLFSFFVAFWALQHQEA